MAKNLDNFWKWVDSRKNDLGITSYRELAKLAGVSHGTINAQRNQNKPPTIETAEGLCRALQVSWLELWVKAGYIQVLGNGQSEDIKQRMVELIDKLPDGEKQLVLELAEWRYQKSQEKKHG